MNRNFALALCIASASIGTAFADDITIDPNPFVSTMTRAQVNEELRQFRTSGVNPWADDYNQLAQARSTMTRGQVRAAYIAARDEVAALDAEDSGSSYLARVAAARHDRATELAVATEPTQGE
jgi:recombinational DNA repair protein RecT